jgi:2-oxoglutarate ferredoxin oxidoreductase subunit beta
MDSVAKIPKMLENETNDFCPGCMLGIAIRLIAELIEEMELSDLQLLPLGVPCPENAAGWGEFSIAKPPFGSSAMSASIKRLHPDRPVIIFQGEGSTASSGISDTIHTANRGEAVTVISINNLCKDNFNSGMSFGSAYSFQSPASFQPPGMPGNLKTAEMIATLPKTQYVARVSLHNPSEILKAKAAIKKALEVQIYHQGYSYVEIMCACPVSLEIEPAEVPQYMQDVILPDYSLSIFKMIEE